MTANTAKYLSSLADIGPKSAEITVFSGIGAISTPYRNRFLLPGTSNSAKYQLSLADLDPRCTKRNEII